MNNNSMNVSLLKAGQKGQALLFVVVSMTIALAVGVSVSLRTLSSVSRVSTTDTGARVLAAAEGGIERALTEDLSALATVCTGNYTEADPAPAECTVSFDPLAGDPVEARAVLTVDSYGDASNYTFTAYEGRLKEVNLSGYDPSAFFPITPFDIVVCWQGDATNLYYIAYGEDGIKKGLACPRVGCVGTVAGGEESNDLNASCTDAYSDNVFTIDDLDTLGTLMGLRLISFEGDSDVMVVSTQGDVLPAQGYDITSVGELVDNGSIQATKTVSVRSSLPYLPGLFDFGVYSAADLIQD